MWRYITVSQGTENSFNRLDWNVTDGNHRVDVQSIICSDLSLRSSSNCCGMPEYSKTVVPDEVQKSMAPKDRESDVDVLAVNADD